MAQWSRRRTLAALAGGATLGGGYWLQARRGGPDCLTPASPEWTVRDSSYSRWSPPVYTDRMVYASHGYGISYTTQDPGLFQITALNEFDGRAHWALNESGGGATPQPHEDSVYVATGANRVYAIDRRRGAVRWRFEGGNQVTESGSFVQPVVADGNVVAGLERPSRDGLPGEQVLVGLATSTGELAWTVPVEGSIQAGLCLAKGTVVVATATGQFYGIDPSNGSERWRTRTDAAIPFVQPATVGESVVIARKSGTVLGLDATTGERRWTTPSVVETQSGDGSTLDRPVRAVTATDSTVLVGGVGGTVHALSAQTGEPLWEFDATAAIASIDSSGTRTAVLDQRGIVHILSLDTGDRQTQFQVAGNFIKDHCGWLPDHDKGTGIAMGDDNVIVTGPWIRKYNVSDL